MNHTLQRKAAVAASILGLMTTAATLRADDDKPIVDRIERRVVVQDDGGEPKVFVWSSKDGEPLPLDAERMLLSGQDGEAIELGRGYLGVQLIDLTSELRQHFGADEKAGVLVGQVEKDSPAAKAGVEVGDIIAAVDGESVAWSGEVGAQVRKKKQGETARLEIVRAGRGQTLLVEVGERKPMRAMFRKIDLGDLPGLEGQPLGPAMARAIKAVQDPAIDEQLRSLSKLREVRAQGLEQRLKELEGRIKQLEKELEAKNRR